MKLIITAINAKYVHTNLAVRYLNSKVKTFIDSEVCEFSINDTIFDIERNIILKKPDIVAFSCYIWNIDMILKLCSDLKKANPNIVLILGGPEVSYNSKELISLRFIDFIIKGEGEIVFPKLIKAVMKEGDLPEHNITYVNKGVVIDKPIGKSPDIFNDIPFPYLSEDLSENKIIYYESSRGCPYSCKYCLSGDNAKVRFKDVETVQKELDFFDKNNVRLVKFVDRTFNADKKRAEQIWSYIDSLNGKTRFHMEITGELLDDATIELLSRINGNKIQFEIGVQSTNYDTLMSINRKCNTDRLFNNVRRLLSETNIHIHLDLIVGLPYETFDIFKNSFNDVLSLRPHVLQIGFLKLLHGSSMREEAERYGIVYRDFPPYEIISSNYISSEEVIFLKDLDYVFDKVYNSGSFASSINFLFERYDDKMEIFNSLINHFRIKQLIGKHISKVDLYNEVYECFGYYEGFEETLRYDYIVSLHPGRMPLWYLGDGEFKFSEEVYDFLKNEDYKKEIMPKYYNVPAKAIIKQVRFEKFKDKIVAFDYSDDQIYDVTKYFKSCSENID